MAKRRKKRGDVARPPLQVGMPIEDFDASYWMKDELIAFARAEGLRTDGYKPQLTARIRRHLLGKPPLKEPVRPKRGRRDSDGPLTRETPVVNFKSDQKTRDFFKAEIGPEFHFTYHMNKFRQSNTGLTYGDLIDEWLAERDRRKNKDYKPVLEKHGEYNLFVRDFFADPANNGKRMRDAAAAWNTVKPTHDRSYDHFRSLRDGEDEWPS
jgi:hypothetical protein